MSRVRERHGACSLKSILVLVMVLLAGNALSGTIIEVPFYHRPSANGAHLEKEGKNPMAIDYGALDKIDKIYKEKRDELYPDYIEQARERRKKEWGKILASPPRTKILKRFSFIESTATHETFKVIADLTVQIHERPDKYNFYYLITPDDGMKYKVAAGDLENLEDILDLRNTPLVHQEYQSPQASNSYQSSLSLSSALNVQYVYDQRPFYESAFEQNGLSGHSFRVENLTFIKGHLPLELGASFGYQEGSAGKGSDDLFSWKNYYLGPMFRFPLLLIGEFPLKIHFGYIFSLNYETVLISTHTVYQLSSNALEIAADLLFTKTLQGMVMGIVYRKEWIGTKDGVDFFSNSNNHEQIPNSSIGLSLGYRWGKNL